MLQDKHNSRALTVQTIANIWNVCAYVKLWRDVNILTIFGFQNCNKRHLICIYVYTYICKTYKCYETGKNNTCSKSTNHTQYFYEDGTWWYLPILTCECFLIIPSVGRSCKRQKHKPANENWFKTDTLLKRRRLTVKSIFFHNWPLPLVTWEVWTSLPHWDPQAQLVCPGQCQTPSSYK